MTTDNGAVEERSDEKPCPYCGESIKAIAKKCRICGEWLDEAARKQSRGNTKARGPLVLQIWGGLLMVGSALLGILSTVQMVMLMGFALRGGPAPAPAVVGMVIGVAFYLAIFGFMFRLGLGLLRRQRAAVIGTGVIGAIFLLLGAVLASKELAPGLVLMAFVFVSCFPPVLVGILRWKELVWKIPPPGSVVSRRDAESV